MSSKPATGLPLADFIRDHSLEVMAVVTCDLNGVARGKKVPSRRLTADDTTPVRISNLMTMLDCGHMPIPPPAEDDGRWWPSWSEGYTDTRVRTDPDTARVVPWQRDTGLVIGDLERVDGGGELDFMPRPTLRRVLARLAGLGFDTRAACELEFMLFRESAQSAFDKGYRDLVPLWPSPQAYCLTTIGREEETIRRLRDHLEGFGVSVETWGAEAGAGQLEMNFRPRPALAAADEAFLFKHAVKEIAAELGLYATFIPKLAAMGFGNGSHLNLSLWKDDRNAFYRDDGNPPISRAMGQVLAGQVATLREFTLLYAPTAIAYRRFVPYFSPGIVACWGVDNKSVGIRAVTESATLARIEQRTAGADVNPYIQMAGCLAAALHGLENELDPPEPIAADAYADPTLPRVASSLDEAIALFEDSEVANEYLGEDFVRFYAHGRRAEARAFAEATSGEDRSPDVTAWELARYFDMA